MKGGRLKIVNLSSSYPTEDVEPLVRFGLEEIDLTGAGLLAVVQDTRRSPYGRAVAYSGRGSDLRRHSVPATFRKLAPDWARYVIRMRLGPPEAFPIRPFTRDGVYHNWQSWQEALVAITGHEGKHVQDYYDRHSSIERGCTAFELHTVRRYRQAQRLIAL